MNQSPAPGVRQSAAKAKATAVATPVGALIGYGLARWLGIGDAPEAAAVVQAFDKLIALAAGTLSAWLATFFTTNEPKE